MIFLFSAVKELRTNFSALTGSDLSETTSDEAEGDVSSLVESGRRNRQAILQDLFTEMDVSGELLDSLNNSSLDPIRQKREQRADSTSISLDPAGFVHMVSIWLS